MKKIVRKKDKKYNFIIFFLCIKMVNKYYIKKQKKLWKEARERYQNLSETEKEKKCQYHRERNKNLSEEEKEKKVVYMREMII